MAKVDTSGLHRKLRFLESVGHEADEAAVIALAGFAAETLADLTPRDTNRAANGWIQAGRAAGVTHIPMLPYQPSRRREEFLKKIEAEMDALAGKVASDESMMDFYRQEDARNASKPTRSGKPRKRRVDQPYYKKLVRRARKNRKSLDRLTEEYKKALGSESFIFFDSDSFIQRRQGRRFSTVRDKIYGGEGRMEKDQNGVRVELINKEPHVRIIERHPHLGHPIATTRAVVYSAGRAHAGRKYLEVARRRLREVA